MSKKPNDTTRIVLIILDFEADIPPCFNGFQLRLLFLSDRGVLFPFSLAFGFGYTGVRGV